LEECPPAPVLLALSPHPTHIEPTQKPMASVRVSMSVPQGLQSKATSGI
jgi:hypothetical protein